MPNARELLQKHFGHAEFRAGQQEVIDTLLAGRSALAVFPTGGGKSLCYQLPALLLPGLTLVISPLIALMKDQVDVLQKKGLAAARLDSTLSAEEAAAIYEKMRRNSLKILYVAPERLANEKFRERLSSLKITLLAIDEAHCISEWGHNFRPDYLKLANFAREQKIPRVLCLTATATPPVSADIRARFDIAESDHTQLTFHRSNLQLRVTPASDHERKKILLARLKSAPGKEATIIYGTLQHSAESLAAFLKKNGIPARPYHAGLRQEVRDEIQDDFMSGKTPVICATIAFGMGIDKADIRAIYHYNLPSSLENYTQEIGRAGRDGAAAHCELFACGDDLRTLQNFIYGDTPSPDSLRALMRRLLDQPEEFDLSLFDLARSHDIRPLVVNTLLTYLELDGYLTATTKFFSTYKIKFTRSLDHLLNGFQPEQQNFLKKIFASDAPAWGWHSLKPETIAEKLALPRQKITETINELEDQGDLIVKPSGVRQKYRLLKKPDDIAALSTRMNELFQKREKADLARLQNVVNYAETPSCHSQKLLAHFGEKSPPCGHCHFCQTWRDRGGDKMPSGCFQPPSQTNKEMKGIETGGLSHLAQKIPIPHSAEPEINAEELSLMQSLIAEKHAALRSSRQLARFLCGLSSPATRYLWYLPAGARRKSRITHHDAYALLESHPFQDVLDFCETLIIS